MSEPDPPITPCQWPVDETCLPPLPEEGTEDYPGALWARQEAEALAVQVLWALSGRQFGLCPAIVRPCPQQCSPCGHTLLLGWNGQDYYNIACGCCPNDCVARGPAVVYLPGPAQQIVAVRTSQGLISPDEYRLEDNKLYRLTGPWPHQNMSEPLYQDGTWSVEYLKGLPVPFGVGRLTGQLAGEFVSACAGGKCRLPRQVTNVTRNGVSYQVYDPNDIYATGKTGLPEVDLWLAAVNPNHLMAAPSVVF